MKALPTLRLAWRLLRRDWRAGELRVLVAALVLAVASVGTVGFFADRVKNALASQANLLLGGDLMISGDRALPSAYADDARARGLATTPVIRFNSMVQPGPGAPADAAAVLTDVKAVGEGYPLRGEIVLVAPGRPEGVRATGRPPRGEVWPDVRLADRLAVKVGDKIAVGESTLTVGAIVQQEPEVAGVVFAFGPKLLLNLDDVPATNLLQPGNRATWRLLVADQDNAGTLDAYRAWLGAEIEGRPAPRDGARPAPRGAPDARARGKIPGARGAGRRAARRRGGGARGVALPAAASRCGRDVPLLRREGRADALALLRAVPRARRARQRAGRGGRTGRAAVAGDC